MANSIINVGQTGSGKTHFVITKIIPNAKNIICFDLYGNEYNLDGFTTINRISEYKGGKARLIHNEAIHDEINDLVSEMLRDLKKLKNTTFVFEDATIFLNSQRDETVKTLLINKRHYNMSFVWLFHTLSEIPPYIFKASTALRLGKTKDMKNAILSKFRGEQNIIDAYEKIQLSKDLRANVFIKI